MGIKRDCIDNAVSTILRMDPSLNKDDVSRIVTQIVKNRLKDPTIYMDNNVTGDGSKIVLTELCNWIENRNPVVSGNATFYVQPDELMSPTSFMLRSLKKGRKEVKKRMFKYKETSDEYKTLDLDQQNKKVIMNAEYGGSGTPTAAFYTKYSPAATTSMAQSIITVMAAFFEGFVGDNQKFFNINECFDWMNIVLSKKKGVDIPKWIYIPTAKDVSSRIKKHLYMPDMSTFPMIDAYINNCTNDELVWLYYANNMKGFVSLNPKISKIIHNVLCTLPLLEAVVDEVPVAYQDKFPPVEGGKNVLDYNKWVAKEMFLDPYNIPESISEDMNKLIDIVEKCVYVEYLTPDSIIKLNNHYRNTVLLVDTDSNVINADIFVSFVLDEIFPGETFERQRMYNDMILVNVLASMMSRCVARTLDYYGRTHNMDEASRAELTMKNEFLFRRFFLMKVKKRYAASIVLREGNIMMPFKLEIKGMDFIKAGVSEEISNKFTAMIKKYILYSDDLLLHDMMKELKQFERDIYKDLRQGGVQYLKPQMYKAKEAYTTKMNKDGQQVSQAWSLPVFRAATVWNELYPDNKIYSLDRVKLLKLIVTGPQDLDRIKDKFPEEYQNAINKIFNSSTRDVANCGLKIIALPASVKQIPDWLIPLIDYDLIISDVIASFKSVTNALDIEDVNFKTANGKANLTSALIAI